jgi:hypothetical protein
MDIEKKVLKFVSEKSPKIRKSVYTIIGNMMATNSSIIFQIFSKNPQIALKIFDTIKNDTHFNVKKNNILGIINRHFYLFKCFKVKKEAIICLSNMVSLATNDILCELIDMKIVENVCSILDIYDPDLLLILLDILNEIINLGFFIQDEESSKTNPILDLIYECNGFEKLEMLSNNPNLKIQKKSGDLLGFFGEENMPLE